MKFKRSVWSRLLAVVIFFVGVGSSRADDAPTRQRTSLDDDWKFLVGDPANARDPAFDDKEWRTVTLPHDWSIEGRFDPKAPMGGAGGFLPAGVGWYRKRIEAPARWDSQRVSVEFEGVYENADVWLNGQHLASHPYGYTSFNVDLTPALKPGAANVLAVRVDNSKQKNSRWYAGSGIYRHVWLTVTDAVHVAPWGVFVSVPQASTELADVVIQTRVVNEGKTDCSLKIRTLISSQVGNEAGLDEDCEVPAGGSTVVSHTLPIARPTLWSPESPQLSRAVTTLSENGKVVDEVTTTFGVRSLAWSAEKGMLLNGKPIKLNGGCIHEDNGVLGTAAFDRAEERKIELLKATGFNEIRTAHAPPAPSVLAACDRLGMLVMENAFDCWDQGKNSQDYHVDFKDWWERDIDSMVLRDRNHPSIIFWDIGNEIPDANKPAGVEYNAKLTARVHALDPTRPVTEAIDKWPKEGERSLFDAQWNTEDIVGTNYHLAQHLGEHAQHPNRILVSTESMPGNPVNGWRDVTGNVFLVGDNVWSAQDYLGEAGIGRWFYEGDPSEPVDHPKGSDDKTVHPIGHGDDRLYPWHGALCGDLDILGERKPMAHWRNVVWDEGEKLYLAVQQPEDDKKIIVAGWGWLPTWESWTWPGREGKTMTAEVYSRHEKVRLYLNGEIVGESDTNAKNGFRAIIKLAYQPGTLRAVGLENGQEVGESILSTAGAPAAIRLTPDRATIHADGQDLSFVKVEVVDKDGKLQPDGDQEITFALTGAGTMAGLGNADLKSEEPYQGTRCRVFHGQAQVVVRATKQPGAVQLRAQADGLAAGALQLRTQ